MLKTDQAIPLEKSYLSVYTGAFYIISLTFLLHFLFSWMGFFFSDDGMNLAFARRILEGQVPHRDFISLRPAGTALLFTPFVKYGGDSVFMLSRLFVFFQYTFVSWAWVRLFVSQLKLPIPLFHQAILALICLLFSLNTFQVVASYTIDGLFFISLGLLLWSATGSTFWAYACMGLAVVCKQSYIFFILLVPFILGDFKRFRTWAFLFFPSFLYVGIITSLQALPDFIQQITAQNSLFQYGFAHFLKNREFSAGLAAGTLTNVISLWECKKRNILFDLFSMAICSLAFLSAFEIAFHNRIFFLGYFTSGFSIGVLIWLFIKYRWQNPLVRWGFAALLLAWCSSLSLASLPVLYGWGLLLQFLLVVSYYLETQSPTLLPPSSSWKNFSLFCNSCLLLLGSGLLLYARHHFVYCQGPAKELTCSMGKLLPGWKGIKVHPRAFACINDLKDLLKKFPHQPYAILPNFAAYWATSIDKNPLPEDWVMHSELNTKPLIEKMINYLESQRDKLIFVLQKFDSNSIATTYFPLPNDALGREHHLITYYIKEHFEKIDETAFHEVYR